MLEIRNLPRVPKKVIIPVAAGIMAMSAGQVKATKPDTFEKTTVTATTNVPNNVAANGTTATDTTTISNQLDLIIPNTSPITEYYNNLSVQDRGNIRREATENVNHKLYNLMLGLAANDVIDKNLVDLMKDGLSAGTINTLEYTTNETDNETLNQIKEDAIKDIVNTQTIAEVLNDGGLQSQKDQIMEAVFGITEGKVKSVKDMKTAVQGNFNYYYDTPMGVLPQIDYSDVHKFFQDAMGKTIEEFTDELIEAPTTEKKIDKIKEFGEKITEKEQSDKDDVKISANAKLNGIMTGVITTLFNIEKGEKKPEGITPQNLQEFFGENPETVTVKAFALSLMKAYNDHTSDINAPTKDDDNLKPGRHRDGLPYITKINGRPAMIQKYVNVKSDGTKEYQYYDIYNYGREVKM